MEDLEQIENLDGYGLKRDKKRAVNYIHERYKPPGRNRKCLLELLAWFEFHHIFGLDF